MLLVDVWFLDQHYTNNQVVIRIQELSKKPYGLLCKSMEDFV